MLIVLIIILSFHTLFLPVPSDVNLYSFHYFFEIDQMLLNKSIVSKTDETEIKKKLTS